MKILKYKRGETSFKILEDEYHKGILLRKLGIPVPKYVGIIQVMISEQVAKQTSSFIHITDPVLRQMLQERFDMPKGYIATGLVIEFIESDDALVKSKALKELFDAEYHKILSKGILPGDNASDCNVLYSKKKNKMYFIDFEYWDLSNYHEEIADQKSKIQFPQHALPKEMQASDANTQKDIFSRMAGFFK